MLTRQCINPDGFGFGVSWSNVRGFVVLFLGGLAILGCTKQVEPPDLRPRLSQTATLELSPSLTEAKAEYTDNCGHMQIVELGGTLQDVLFDATSRTFKSLIKPGSGSKADVVVGVKLVQSSFKLRMDLYDRADAELLLGALVSYVDQAGNPLGEQDVQVTQKRRVRIQPVQKNCDYLVDEFFQDAAHDFAQKFADSARNKFGTGAQLTAATATPAAIAIPSPTKTASSGKSPLSFKATMLDENGNLLFEGGERIRVRVDIVNSGDQDFQNVTANLTGTPSLLAQFPATTLSAGRLQPGQSRSLEFVATLPQAIQQQKAEIQVSILDPAAGALPSQTLPLSIQPTGAKVDDIDQLPAASAEFKRPNTYLVSIGIGSYRDQQLSMRKYAASDAELLTSYFQSLGGLPAANVRLLQDWKALRPDIDEALLDWLPAHMNKDAVVIVYFAGLATVAPTGDVYLVPYDGNAVTTSRSYPLKELESALSRLKAKQTLFLFDGMVTRLGGDSRNKTGLPQWNPSGSSTVHVIATNGLGKVVEDENHRHGLFTYYLLRALRGESDLNRDGEVTLGEAIAYLNQKVLWASKARYGQEQRPAVLPPLTDAASGLALTKLAAIRAMEIP